MSDRRRERDNRRTHNNNGPEEAQFQQRPARKPLERKLLDTVRKGNVQIEINGADSDRGGRIYSARVGKVLPARHPGEEDRVIPWLAPEDLVNLKEAITQVTAWIDTDRAEIHDKNNRQRRFG